MLYQVAVDVCYLSLQMVRPFIEFSCNKKIKIVSNHLKLPGSASILLFEMFYPHHFKLLLFISEHCETILQASQGEHRTH